MHAQRVLGFGLGPRLPAFGPVSSADQVFLPAWNQVQQMSKEARKYLKSRQQGLALGKSPSIGALLDANLAQQREEAFQAPRSASVGVQAAPPRQPQAENEQDDEGVRPSLPGNRNAEGQLDPHSLALRQQQVASAKSAVQ